jgi:hypothetical protein
VTRFYRRPCSWVRVPMNQCSPGTTIDARPRRRPYANERFETSLEQLGSFHYSDITDRTAQPRHDGRATTWPEVLSRNRRVGNAPRDVVGMSGDGGKWEKLAASPPLQKTLQRPVVAQNPCAVETCHGAPPAAGAPRVGPRGISRPPSVLQRGTFVTFHGVGSSGGRANVL